MRLARLMCSLWLSAALLIFGDLGAAMAQMQGLVGTWRGQAYGIVITLVVTPDGRFSEQQVSGSLMTLQSGYVAQHGPDVITLVVEDWEPKSMRVYNPVGTSGGYWTVKPMSKPPGGTWRIAFSSRASVMFRDMATGAAIAFHRVQ